MSDMGDNSEKFTDLEKWTMGACDEYTQLEKERDEINAKLGEIRATAKAKGINIHAFKHARAVAKMDDDKRAGYDVSFAHVRKCVGIPVQDDLFDASVI